MGIWSTKTDDNKISSAMNVEDLQFIILILDNSMAHYAYMLMDKLTEKYEDKVSCAIWDIDIYKNNLHKLSSYNKILAIGDMKKSPFRPTNNISKDVSDGTIIQISGNHGWITFDVNCKDYDLFMIDARWKFKDDCEGFEKRLRLLDDVYKNRNKVIVNKMKLMYEQIKDEVKDGRMKGFSWWELLNNTNTQAPDYYGGELGWWVFGINRFFDKHLDLFLGISEEHSL